MLEQVRVSPEPSMKPLTHEVPMERRWTELSGGRATVYGMCPPSQFPRSRIEHGRAGPAQPLSDLWPLREDGPHPVHGSRHTRSERHTPAHTRRPRPQRFRW
ncbi:DUF6083 domain-containing protein [Streptomyces sp. NPDC093586]|uniref:DUF6083 domain-containing protein n=1 Tax=Streptomyces sp. NPDC093586 TaxID=3366042 RepID=UPI0038050EA1